MNYYNEFDPNAAEWLRQLIGMKAIPEGHVDERSITDVTGSDLRGYTQCHFFAGIAGWSLALERAGVPATRPLWTGSCPCQAFSCAGKQQGVEDSRDLWPHFFRLIRECRPERVFGEQVEAAVGHGWLDRLSADMEAEGYAVGAVVLGAHSAGADHIRQRIYWVADAIGIEEHKELGRSESDEGKRGSVISGGCGVVSRLADATNNGHASRDGLRKTFESPITSGALSIGKPSGSCHVSGLADPVGERGRGGQSGREDAGDAGVASQTRNFWSDARPHLCKDGKWRRFEPGVFPLVDVVRRNLGRGGDSGVQMPDDPITEESVNATGEARVMRLKGYGNAICVETARMFIEACEDVLQ